MANCLHEGGKQTYFSMKLISIIGLTAMISSFAISSQAQTNSTKTETSSGLIIKAGINRANVSIDDDGDVDEAKALTSFHVGLTGDFSITSFLSVQPGILFTGKGSKTQQGQPSDASYYRATTNPYYIEIPVNLVFKAPLGDNAKFFAGAGPYLGIGVAGKVEREGKIFGAQFESEDDIEFSNDDPSTFDYEEGAGFGIMKRFDYGINGLAGIEGKSVMLGVNYGLGLAKLQSGSNSSADDNNKHRVWSFTVGFKL